jgi:hypothetical protein
MLLSTLKKLDKRNSAPRIVLVQLLAVVSRRSSVSG